MPIFIAALRAVADLRSRLGGNASHRSPIHASNRSRNAGPRSLHMVVVARYASSPTVPVDKEKPMITQDLQPYFSTPAEPPITFLGLPTVVRATAQTTNGAFGLIEHLTIRPGFASPYHTHRLEDEAWYILEGQVAFVC